MGEPDFEIRTERIQNHTKTEISRRKQFSPTPAFVRFCQLLLVALSQFLHSPKKTPWVNSEPASRIAQASPTRSDCPESEAFSLTTNQVPPSKSLCLDEFFATVQRLCKTTCTKNRQRARLKTLPPVQP